MTGAAEVAEGAKPEVVVVGRAEDETGLDADPSSEIFCLGSRPSFAARREHERGSVDSRSRTEQRSDEPKSIFALGEELRLGSRGLEESPALGEDRPPTEDRRSSSDRREALGGEP